MQRVTRVTKIKIETKMNSVGSQKGSPCIMLSCSVLSCYFHRISVTFELYFSSFLLLNSSRKCHDWHFQSASGEKLFYFIFILFVLKRRGF